MTDIIAALSGKVGKGLVLGALLPAALFLLVGLHFVRPLLPASWPLDGALGDLDTAETAIQLALTALVVAGFLYALNVPILRLYEGYQWRYSRIGARRAAAYRERFAAREAFWRGGRALLRDERFQTHARGREFLAFWSRRGIRLHAEFPGRGDLVMPTKLGNAIRCFEHYPDRQYGMFGVTLWPRLIAKVDPAYASTIGDAKALVDLAINCSLLSAVLAAGLLASGLAYEDALDRAAFWGLPGVVGWLLQVAALVLLSVLFYNLAVDRAVAWGAAVKGAFDLYRSDLLKQLGHQQVPRTRAQERGLWASISYQLATGDGAYGPRPDYAPGMSVEAEPDDIVLEGVRCQAKAADGATEVRVAVTNADPRRRTAKRLVLEEVMAAGAAYEWGSAKAGERAVRVLGANPYRFLVDGEVVAGEVVEVAYRTTDGAGAKPSDRARDGEQAAGAASQ